MSWIGPLAAAGALLCAGVAQGQATAAAQVGPADDPADASADAPDVVVTGSRRANASINGLVVDPLLLPQSMRVLDDALVDRAGLIDLSQLFDLAGGLSCQNSFGGAWDAYAIRGFSGDINQDPDLLVNRFSSNRGCNARRDVATVESFQVLKGPASALSGKGEPGGSINIVTKAPLDRFHAGADWRPAVLDGLSLDLGVFNTGAIVATCNNLVRMPARTLVNLGGRDAMLRARVTNLGNAYGFELRGAGAYDIIPGRVASAYLTVDL